MLYYILGALLCVSIIACIVNDESTGTARRGGAVVTRLGGIYFVQNRVIKVWFANLSARAELSYMVCKKKIIQIAKRIFLVRALIVCMSASNNIGSSICVACVWIWVQIFLSVFIKTCVQFILFGMLFMTRWFWVLVREWLENFPPMWQVSHEQWLAKFV